MLNFDAETHTYTTEEGLLVPGVTDILGDLNIRKTGVYPPGAAERGKRIHSLLEYYDKGTLDYNSVTDEDLALIEKWDAAKEDLKITGWTGIEQIVFSKSLWYAGTADRVAGDMVIDIKSGGKEEWHQLQVAAYGYALGTRFAAVVYLKTGKVDWYSAGDCDDLVQEWGHIRKAWKWCIK